jgi:hypothetical protein
MNDVTQITYGFAMLYSCIRASIRGRLRMAHPAKPSSLVHQSLIVMRSGDSTLVWVTSSSGEVTATLK